MLKRLLNKWKQYRYRFVPWIAFNLKDRSIRSVSKVGLDKVIPDSEVGETLIHLFTALYNGSSKQSGSKAHILQQKSSEAEASNGNHSKQYYKNLVCHLRLESNRDVILCGVSSHSVIDCSSHGIDELRFNGGKLRTSDESVVRCLQQRGFLHQRYSYNSQHPQTRVEHKYNYLRGLHTGPSDPWDQLIKEQYGCRTIAAHNLQVMKDTLGYTIERMPSVLPGGGTGVKVTQGRIPKGVVVAMYPGMVYHQFEPILLQSLGNPFIFRCIDSLLIDGNDKAISKFIYRSCAQRERVGPYFTCDMTWVTKAPANPMAVGQYVNNHSKAYPPNVAYQEFDVPVEFPFHLRKYIPNVYYSANLDRSGSERLMRTVVLVSLRDIEEGEELFSSYFTVVH